MPQTLLKATEPANAQIRHYGPGDPERARVEGFIRRIYAERFQAHVKEFAPVLVGLHDREGTLLAAAGYRAADAGPLFLERYLNQPVEQMLRGPAATPEQRQGIVEVGHLASDRAGEGRRLILLLGPLLAAAGFEWVVSTLTQELRHLFVRMGVAPLALGYADPALLGHAATDWGCYYDHQPVVLAGQIPVALKALNRRGELQAGLRVELDGVVT
jgi:hypothetical protein